MPEIVYCYHLDLDLWINYSLPMRQVETPRKFCQTVFDLYEDVVVTKKCREVVTTTCTQTTQTATHTSAVVDTSTNLVQARVYR